MIRFILGLFLVLSLTACNASSGKAADQPAGKQTETAAADSVKAAKPDQKLEKYKVTFLELGAESCIPCKMMKPIMKDITEEYPGVVEVIFHDLYKNRTIGQEYGIRVMPTQVFLDSNGKEFFRHEGFYAKAELKAMLDKYLANLDM